MEGIGLAHKILLHVISSQPVSWVSTPGVILEGHLLKLTEPSVYCVAEWTSGAEPLPHPQSSTDLNVYCTKIHQAMMPIA